MSIPVTLTGGLITDTVRAAALEGDGLSSSDSSTGVWVGATNLVTNNGFETDASGWVLQGSATIAQTTSKSKFGSGSLQVTTNGIATGEGAGESGNKTPASVTTVYSVSMWVNAPNGATLRLVMKEYLAGVFVRDTGSTNLTGNGNWTRVTFTGTTGVGMDGIDPRIETTTTAQAIVFYIDGVQIEQTTLCTPYTRTSRVDGFVALTPFGLNESQGWVAVRLRLGWGTLPSNVPIIAWWGDDANNRLIFYFTGDSTQTWATRQIGGAGTFVNQNISAPTVGTFFTGIFSWTATTIAISNNGSPFTSNGNTSIPALSSRAYWLLQGSGFDKLQADCFWAAIGTGTLSDNDSKIINSFGNSDRNPNEFPGSCAAVWNGKDNFATTPGDVGQLYSPPIVHGHGAC